MRFGLVVAALILGAASAFAADDDVPAPVPPQKPWWQPQSRPVSATPAEPAPVAPPPPAPAAAPVIVNRPVIVRHPVVKKVIVVRHARARCVLIFCH
jgi:hypothetical protein